MRKSESDFLKSKLCLSNFHWKYFFSTSTLRIVYDNVDTDLLSINIIGITVETQQSNKNN